MLKYWRKRGGNDFGSVGKKSISNFYIWIGKKCEREHTYKTVNSGYHWAEPEKSNEEEGFHILCMY